MRDPWEQSWFIICLNSLLILCFYRVTEDSFLHMLSYRVLSNKARQYFWIANYQLKSFLFLLINI